MSIYRGIPDIDLTLEMVLVPNYETTKLERHELKHNITVKAKEPFGLSHPGHSDRLTLIGRDKSGIRYSFTMLKVNNHG